MSLYVCPLPPCYVLVCGESSEVPHVMMSGSSLNPKTPLAWFLKDTDVEMAAKWAAAIETMLLAARVLETPQQRKEPHYQRRLAAARAALEMLDAKVNKGAA